MQAEVIRALVLNRDWTRIKGKQEGGKEFSVLVEYIRHPAEANDREFFKRLGRALTNNRKYKNTEIEDFLFTHWDTTQGTLAHGPGLKCLLDKSVVGLLKTVFGDRAPKLAAYREIRKAANLQPERPAKIKRVTLGPDGIKLHPFR